MLMRLVQQAPGLLRGLGACMRACPSWVFSVPQRIQATDRALVCCTRLGCQAHFVEVMRDRPSQRTQRSEAQLCSQRLQAKDWHMCFG